MHPNLNHAAIPPAVTAALIEAQDIAYALPGIELLSGLSFTLRPGLTLVRGGDGRGKTTLLRLIAGVLQPSRGTLRSRAATLSFEQPAEPMHDAVITRAWLTARQRHHAHWQAGLAAELIDAFDLTPHLDKPLYMLSTGSRRKVGWVAAAASGAQLTLLDMPFAALDRPSCNVLTARLAKAAAQADRAWVIADYERPEGLAGVALAGLIDLGD
ncbi:MAG: ATP-binding cassette domain-containing protein [Burkholderiales bacterium]